MSNVVLLKLRGLVLVFVALLPANSWAITGAGPTADLQRANDAIVRLIPAIATANSDFVNAKGARDTAKAALDQIQGLIDIQSDEGLDIPQSLRDQEREARATLATRESEFQTARGRLQTLVSELERQRSSFNQALAELPQGFRIPTSITQININNQPPKNGSPPTGQSPPSLGGAPPGGGGSDMGGGGGNSVSTASTPKNDSGGGLGTGTAPGASAAKVESPQPPAQLASAGPTSRPSTGSLSTSNATTAARTQTTTATTSVAQKALGILNLSGRAPTRAMVASTAGTRVMTRSSGAAHLLAKVSDSKERVSVVEESSPVEEARTDSPEAPKTAKRFMDLPPGGGVSEIRAVAESGHRGR